MKKIIFLLFGEKIADKEKHISALKQQCLTTPDAVKLDYETYSAHKLDFRSFQETLRSLPAVSPQKFVLLRDCQKLSKDQKEALVKYALSPSPQVRLVLEAGALTAADPLLKGLKTAAEISDFSAAQKQNVFDMTRAMAACQPQEALNILSVILNEGDQPVQIMGGLVWFWCKKAGQRLNPDRYEKGLQLLQEADLNIKRSRLRPDYALEVVVVRLTELLA